MNFLKQLGERFLYIIIGIVIAAIGVIVVIVGWGVINGADAHDNGGKILGVGLIGVLIGGALVVFAFKKNIDEPDQDEKSPPENKENISTPPSPPPPPQS